MSSSGYFPFFSPLKQPCLPQTPLLLFSSKTLQSTDVCSTPLKLSSESTMTFILLKSVINVQSSPYPSYQQHLVLLIAVSYWIIFLKFVFMRSKLLGFFPTSSATYFQSPLVHLLSPKSCYTSVHQHLPFITVPHFLDDLMSSNVTSVLMTPKFSIFRWFFSVSSVIVCVVIDGYRHPFWLDVQKKS